MNNPIKSTPYLYIVKCGDAVKIGVSTLPEQRVSLIRTDNHQEVTLVAILALENAYLVEKELHSILKGDGYHLRGEWFSLPAPVDEEVLRMIIGLDKELSAQHGT